MRLAQDEAELAAVCGRLAMRMPEAAGGLSELATLHEEALALLRARGGPAPAIVAMGSLFSPGSLPWLRDRELALARDYLELFCQPSLSESERELISRQLAPSAWRRYMRAERLAAMIELGELSPA
jgi:hypothetical protein